ncbi:MAG TPA: N-acetyl-gamma-glutamyl-phosphate reductase [bacterium]|nr:N-acetyl-gamma-glutamyl-phosphate reductase [bacterium]
MAEARVEKIRCAVVGASGYAGLEVLRLLSTRPDAEVVFATSNTYNGKSVSETFPQTLAPRGLKYSPHSAAPDFKDADVFFLALPHGKSYDIVEALLETAVVIDISADFRLYNPADYEKWYSYEHPKPELLKTAVYGLCEVYREKIQGARLVANPGCYPTSVALATRPLSKIKSYVAGPIIIDSKSGYSGAGRSLKPHLLFCEATNEFAPYGMVGHRHTSEMLQETAAALEQVPRLTFTPHLIPVSRGILTTICVPLEGGISEKEIRETYESFYPGEPFAVVAAPGRIPSVKQVVGTNVCLMNVFYDSEQRILKIVSAIDNLIKGAAGQAIQNMNIVFGLEETSGLLAAPWMP